LSFHKDYFTSKTIQFAKWSQGKYTAHQKCI
jgi:hypothetical protein